MKYVFVGDIHGKWEAVEQALAMDGHKIFVGDIMDSYNRTWHDHAKCFDLILEAIKKGEAECLFGNHELSYLIPQVHRCSGYNFNWAHNFEWQYKRDVEHAFQNWIYKQDVNLLVTHAGVTNQLYEGENITEYLEGGINPYNGRCHTIGEARGGRKGAIGGIFWCDWNDEFQPIPGLIQVVGHTQGRGIRQKGTDFEQTGLAYCIDCLDDDGNYKFLKMEI